MSDDIFIKHDKNGGTFQQPFLARVPASGQEPNIAQRVYQVTTQGTQPFTYDNRISVNVRQPSDAQNPIIAQGVAQTTYQHRSPAIYTSRAPSIYNIQTPSTYQHRSPLTYDHRSPFTYQLNYQHREPSTYQHRSPLIYRTPTQTRTPSIYTNRQPLTYEHRSPFTYDHRSPLTYDHRSPSQTPSTYQNRQPLIYDHRSPYRSPFTYQHRSPFTYQHRSPSTYDNREPSIYQHRSPDTYQHQSPLTYDHRSPFRSPSIYQHQSPSIYQHRSPFQSPVIYQHQSPSIYQHRSPFRSPSIYQHQSPSIYNHRSPFRTPIIVNTQNSRNARTPYAYVAEDTTVADVSGSMTSTNSSFNSTVTMIIKVTRSTGTTSGRHNMNVGIFVSGGGTSGTLYWKDGTGLSANTVYQINYTSGGIVYTGTNVQSNCYELEDLAADNYTVRMEDSISAPGSNNGLQSGNTLPVGTSASPATGVTTNSTGKQAVYTITSIGSFVTGMIGSFKIHFEHSTHQNYTYECDVGYSVQDNSGVGGPNLPE